MKQVILFVSTGRCGTQWLARHLGELYPVEAEVTHEPLGALYRSARYFRDYRDPRRPLELEEVASHVAAIDNVLQERSYIETGWPLFGAIPLFIELFGTRLRLVHLVRHPVPTSISHSVHQSYFGSPRVDDYTLFATLHPGLPGVFQNEAADRWEGMSPYEKCLYWWTELNLYALELKDRFPQVPQHFVRSEELLAGERAVTGRLLEHLGLPDTGELARRADRLEDRWHHRTERSLDWRAIHGHPRALELAERFGYDVDALDEGALAGRYRGRPPTG